MHGQSFGALPICGLIDRLMLVMLVMLVAQVIHWGDMLAWT